MNKIVKEVTDKLVRETPSNTNLSVNVTVYTGVIINRGSAISKNKKK